MSVTSLTWPTSPVWISSSTNTSHLFLATASGNTLWDENKIKALAFLPVVLYLILLMISGFIGNCLVCYVYHFRFRRSSANSFIFCLGVLDLASCSIGMPFEICDLSYPYMFDAPMACRLLRFIESITIMASAATLVSVAFDRYFKICKPFYTFPLHKVRVLCVVSVLLSVCMSWPALVIFGRRSIPTSDPNIDGIECTIDDSIKDIIYPTLYYGTLLGVFIIALCFITTLYTLIGQAIWKVKRTTIGEVLNSSSTRRPSTVSLQLSTSSGCVPKDKRRHSAGNISHTAKQPRQLIRAGRTTLIFVTVTAIFVLSFLPFLTVTLMRAAKLAFHDFNSQAEEIIYNICVRSYFINNSVNPIIYSVLNVNFRQECCATFRQALKLCTFCKSKDMDAARDIGIQQHN